jgi:hypothetical protein
MRIVSSVWVILPLFLQSSFIVATNTAEVGLREEGYGNDEDFVVDVDVDVDADADADADVDVDADVDADADVDVDIVTHEKGQEEEDYNDLRLLKSMKKQKNSKYTNKTSKNAKKNAKKTLKPTPSPTDSPTSNPTPSPTDSPTTNPTISSQPTSLSDGALRFPPKINASDGKFDLTMVLVNYTTIAANRLTTRLFDGIMVRMQKNPLLMLFILSFISFDLIFYTLTPYQCKKIAGTHHCCAAWRQFGNYNEKFINKTR